MASSQTSIAEAVLDICWTIREAMTSKFLRSKVAPENEAFKNYATRFPNFKFNPFARRNQRLGSIVVWLKN